MLRAVSILCLGLLLGGCGSDTPEPPQIRGGQLVLGTEKREAIHLLKALGAVDIGEGMQVELAEGQSSANWMWSLKRYDVTVETQYEGGVISQLNVWDWRGRKKTSYHHKLEYYSIDRLDFNKDGTAEYSILETFNKGK